MYEELLKINKLLNLSRIVKGLPRLGVSRRPSGGSWAGAWCEVGGALRDPSSSDHQQQVAHGHASLGVTWPKNPSLLPEGGARRTQRSLWPPSVMILEGLLHFEGISCSLPDLSPLIASEPFDGWEEWVPLRKRPASWSQR